MTHTRTHMAPEFTGADAHWFTSSYSDGAGTTASRSPTCPERRMAG